MTHPIRDAHRKTWLDGHAQRRAITLAMGLRDEGAEVIYTGVRQSPENIVRTCVQENVEVLGLSLLSGAQLLLSEGAGVAQSQSDG